MKLKMNWLAIDKNVWRRIFQILSDSQHFLHGKYDICTLRSVCRYLRNASLLRMNGIRWDFKQNSIMGSCARFIMPEPPIWDQKPSKAPEDIVWECYIKKRRPVFQKKNSLNQPLESISWCEPNERTKERGARRSHHQKKRRERGDFRRSGAMYEPCEHGGYIRTFYSPSELGERLAWTKIETVLAEKKDVYGVVRYKYVSERQWKDKITNVVYYHQKYCYVFPADLYSY